VRMQESLSNASKGDGSGGKRDDSGQGRETTGEICLFLPGCWFLPGTRCWFAGGLFLPGFLSQSGYGLRIRRGPQEFLLGVSSCLKISGPVSGHDTKAGNEDKNVPSMTLNDTFSFPAFVFVFVSAFVFVFAFVFVHVSAFVSSLG
jgi:hypothetical protein